MGGVSEKYVYSTGIGGAHRHILNTAVNSDLDLLIVEVIYTPRINFACRPVVAKWYLPVGALCTNGCLPAGDNQPMR